MEKTNCKWTLGSFYSTEPFFFLIANYQVYDLANVLLNVLLKLQIVA